jgi:hypothetical protein
MTKLLMPHPFHFIEALGRGEVLPPPPNGVTPLSWFNGCQWKVRRRDIYHFVWSYCDHWDSIGYDGQAKIQDKIPYSWEEREAFRHVETPPPPIPN